MSQSSSPFAQSSNHYEAIARKVDAMLECAADIGDETLFLRAQEYLCILEHEEYTALNRPACLDGLIACGKGMSRGRPSPNFSIKVLFETMLRVTDELGMLSANRYISAAICVCVAREDSSDVLVGAEAARDVQAARLSYLGVVWIAYALWPFVANTGSRMPDREDDYEFPVDPTTTNVLSRDDFRCCMTGHPEWCVIRQANERGYDTNFAARLAPVHIFAAVDEAHQTQTRSLAVTAELFQRIYECPPVFVDEDQANIPQNTFLLSGRAQYALNALHACFKPTAVPHRYRLVVYRGQPLTSESDPYREFQDHTLDAFEKRLCPDEYWQEEFHAAPDPALRGVPLPDAALLRARAAMAAILHESAVVQALDGLRYRKGEEVPAADGESFMRHLRGLGYEGSWVCSS